MRITLIALHFSEYSCRLAVALAQQHDVQLILSAPNVAAELEDEFDVLQAHPRLTVVLLQHSRSPALYLRNAVRLVTGIKRFNPDVIHSHEDPKDYLVFALALLKRHYCFVMTVHDPIPHTGGDATAHYRTRQGFYQRLLRGWCDAAITHGEQLRRDLVASAPNLSGRVANIPHGPLGSTHISTKEPDPGALLFFGRINAYKGLRYFVAAILQLRVQGYAVTGIIAGRGEDLAPNRAVIEANDCFELHEEFVSRAKLHEFFGRAQLVVMPYTDATQSGVAAMAMGFGRPMVATRVGSIPEMVRDGTTGLLVAPKDASALADAISTLLSNPALYAQLAGNIRTACAGEFSWASIAASTTRVYSDAITSRTRQIPSKGLTQNFEQRKEDHQ